MDTDIALTCALVAVTTAGTAISFYTGKSHYGARTPELFDAAHAVLPDMRTNTALVFANAYLMPLVVFACAFRAGVQAPYMRRTSVALIVRALLTTVTVLPSACDIEQLSFMDYIQGHCYDKIPSGHFIVAGTLLWMLYKRGTMRAADAAIAAVAVALCILLVRAHYTIDIAVSALLILAIDGLRIPQLAFD
jgi:hypothetical protein